MHFVCLVCQTRPDEMGLARDRSHTGWNRRARAMFILTRALMICVILAPAAALSQSGSSRSQRIPTLAPDQVVFEDEEQLEECKNQVAFWKAKADETQQRNEVAARDASQLRYDYERLRSQKVFGAYTAAITIAILAVGIGLGIGLLNKMVLAWKRFTPTPAKRQLAVLLICFFWICGCLCFLSFRTGVLLRRPGDFLIIWLVLCLPALLFGGIAFWWLERQRLTSA